MDDDRDVDLRDYVDDDDEHDMDINDDLYVGDDDSIYADDEFRDVIYIYIYIS